MSWIATFRTFRRSVLGLNRRNQDFVFRTNLRDLFHLVDNKVAAKLALAARGVPTPATFAVLSALWQLGRLRSSAHRLGGFVLKPARGSGGSGVLAVAGRDGDGFVKPSGVRLRAADLEAHAADILAGAFSRNQRQDEVLVEAMVRSREELARLSFGGVADVRVLVFLGVPVLAMLRLPTRRSDGRANLHMGGIGVGVDLVSGLTLGAFGPSGPIERHPDLDVSLGGIVLPLWEEVLEVSARCYDAIPLGYFGADIVLDAARGPLVLELNARPGLGIQVANHRGLRPLLEAVERRRAVASSLGDRVALGREIFTASALLDDAPAR